MQILKMFLTGMMISFMGTLPLGTLNVSAMQISVTEGIQPAILFSIGALLVEVGYVKVSLVAMQRILKHRAWLVRLGWATFLLIAALAAASFWTATHPSVQKNPILSETLPRFWLGALMSAINPMQIPFWFGWSTVLYDRGVLSREDRNAYPYLTGIGLGTFLGNLIFIMGGRLLVDRLQTNQSVFNWIIGGIFAATAILQLVRMTRGGNSGFRIPDSE
jgi:threonine/homoserine/homoserine lactone efflux protein